MNDALQTAMFRARAGKFGTPVPSENMRALQQYCHELEGQVHQMEGRCRKLEERIRTLTVAPNRITIELIKRVVCVEFHISESVLLARRNDQNTVMPRQIAMYLGFVHTPSSSTVIGKSFGGYHRTAIKDAYKRISDQREKDPVLDKRLCGIEHKLQTQVQS